MLGTVATTGTSVRRIRTAVAAVLAAVSGLVITTQVAHAAAITCANASLVSAISTANSTPGGGTVTLPAGCTFTLTAANNSTDGSTGLPVITGTVTIVGSGATIARSSANGIPAFRFFDVGSSGHLTLGSVTLNNGLTNDGQHGGGAIDSHGTLAITASTFTANKAPATSGTSGGAIDNSGTMTLATSTFSGNVAMEGGGVFNENISNITQTTFTNNTGTIYGGGAILNGYGTTTVTASTFVGNNGTGGGAIDNDTTITVSDSTFYNNTGGSNGGGAIQNFGTITLNQSTLSGNTSQYGANIHNYGSSKVTLNSSIVANGIKGSNCGGPAVIDGGYNLDTGTSCGFSTAKHSLSNSQPQLQALASNGGPTQTMGLPPTSVAVNVIPSSVSGCGASTDQRGTARPQGAGCEIGAYEVIASAGDTQPPTVPTGLTAPSVTANSVTLRWNPSTDNVGVTGYTVYRNGSVVGSTGGPTATTFTDVTAAPSTAYSYAVDAFDGAGNHSVQTAPQPVTTPAPSGFQGVQGGAVTTPTRVTQATIPLTSTIGAGDLLVGWFGQYDATGQVQVSDDVNGVWTRSASTTFSSGAGDIALYYVQNAAASPYGVTVTIAASSATYLEGAASDYSGVARAGAFDQVATARGLSAAVDSGATGAVPAGELVVGGILTGGSPTSVTPGSSQGQTFTLRAQSTAGSADLEDVLSGAAGAQDARATFGTATDWYAVAATFHPFGSGDTQPPTTPTGLTQGTVTTTSAAFSWTASTDNVGVAGYTVYRNGAFLGTTGAAVTSYTDSKLTPSTTYTYTVDAFDAAGNHSTPSAALPITTAAPDTQPPSTPTALTQGTVTATSAAFSWTASTDNVGVTGYTVYRNGAFLATTGAAGTSYTDNTVAPSTAYSYTVDAFDAAGNHSTPSTALPITTPAAPPPTARWVQGGAIATGSKVASVTITLPGAVSAGDLLVGWFGQYDSTGKAAVSDNVNGAWTRSSTAITFSSGGGDIALFYVQNAKAAPAGVTVTISAPAATYLQGSASDYAGIALTNSLDSASAAMGKGTAADSGATGSVSAGEILISGFMTGTGPGTVTPGSGMTLRDHTGSYSVDDATATVGTTGVQHALWTLQTSADWYVVAAVFHTAAGP